MNNTALNLSVANLHEDVRVVDERVYRLVIDELKLESVDPILYLYIIIKLGGSNSSANWLMNQGLSEDVILGCIKKFIPVREEQPSRIFKKRSKPVDFIVKHTQASNRMLDYLVDVALEREREDSKLRVYHLLEAAVMSQSAYIEDLFSRVNLTMSDVCDRLRTPSAISR